LVAVLSFQLSTVAANVSTTRRDASYHSVFVKEEHMLQGAPFGKALESDLHPAYSVFISKTWTKPESTLINFTGRVGS
jgi:hypothetical protein